MNTHDLTDLETVARTLRHRFGSTLVVKDPDTKRDINIVLLLEDVVSNCRMEERSRDIPRGRHVRKAYLPTEATVQVKGSRAAQEQE